MTALFHRSSSLRFSAFSDPPFGGAGDASRIRRQRRAKRSTDQKGRCTDKMRGMGSRAAAILVRGALSLSFVMRAVMRGRREGRHGERHGGVVRGVVRSEFLAATRGDQDASPWMRRVLSDGSPSAKRSVDRSWCSGLLRRPGDDPTREARRPRRRLVKGRERGERGKPRERSKRRPRGRAKERAKERPKERPKERAKEWGKERRASA